MPDYTEEEMKDYASQFVEVGPGQWVRKGYPLPEEEDIDTSRVEEKLGMAEGEQRKKTLGDRARDTWNSIQDRYAKWEREQEASEEDELAERAFQLGFGEKYQDMLTAGRSLEQRRRAVEGWERGYWTSETESEKKKIDLEKAKFELGEKKRQASIKDWKDLASLGGVPATQKKGGIRGMYFGRVSGGLYVPAPKKASSIPIAQTGISYSALRQAGTFKQGGTPSPFPRLTPNLNLSLLRGTPMQFRLGNPGNSPQTRWFNPTVHTGWEKDMPAIDRRRLMLDAHGGDYLSAARAMQALANVTKDKKTKSLATGDALFFFKEYKRYK